MPPKTEKSSACYTWFNMHKDIRRCYDKNGNYQQVEGCHGIMGEQAKYFVSCAQKIQKK